MAEWEHSYLEAIVEALHPKGEVLEVGFGSGFAAAQIQKRAPIRHTIIEKDEAVAKKASEWAKPFANVKVIHSTWQQALPTLGVFDAILFNDSPKETLAERRQRREAGNLALKKGRETLAVVEAALPQLQSIRYSDKDIHDFFEKFGKKHLDQIAMFFAELKSRKHISQEQYEKVLKTYSLDRVEAAGEVVKVDQPLDVAFACLQSCLQKHMKKGSRFSCVCNDSLYKYEDPQFFEKIITNPDCEYQEKTIPVKVPCSCETYPFQEALVMVVEKLA